ncbi:MAG: acyl-CoA/acyl-ACP dehydrogenase [Cytophagales bacterium]|nr:acyl-CoA/acyl-ACP dehydrogenase [Armatimonadota bacterium]
MYSEFGTLPPPAPTATLMADLQAAIAEDLRPNLREIDEGGKYPRAFLERVGAIGGFRQGTPTALGGAGNGLRYTIQIMEEISRDCLSTGFCYWCHTVCAWYAQTGGSDFLKQEILPRLTSGQMLGATGMSNPMKHFAGIEKIRLTATRCDGGYQINGALPWVSNAVSDGCFGAVARIAGTDGDYLMAIIPARSSGLELGDGGHFIALEGSSTHNAIFRDVFLPDEWVLAAPCAEYIARIRPGFMLTQSGFGLGLVRGCIDLMKRSNDRVGHVNCYLEDGAERIETDLKQTQETIYALADEIGCGDQAAARSPRDLTRDVVRARLSTSELALRASQAAMLHCGAGGYRAGSIAERKLRESYFVAVVTPAMKHLKKVLHDLETPLS